MVIIFTDLSLNTRRAGAYRIASSLRKIGVEVEVIDFLAGWNVDELLSILDNFTNIDWIGVSLTYSNFDEGVDKASKLTDLSDIDEIKFIKYFRARNIPIVLGGANADTIKNFVENYIIVLGYADKSVIELHHYITINKTIKFENINNNKVIFSDRDYSDIDLSETETLYMPNDYVASNDLLPIEISRGCIFKCAFCDFPHLGKKPGTYIRSKNSIKDDIVRAYDQFGIKSFLFVDDTFNDSVEKMQLIADIRKETGINFTFWSYGRLDLLGRYQEMFNLIPETGWTQITFGIETLNKKSGSSIGKGADPEKQKNTLLRLRKTYPYLYLQANLIVGLPHSSKEDIKDSIDWFLSNNVVDFLRVIPLDIRDSSGKYSGSVLSNNPKKFGYEIISTDRLRYNWQNNNWSKLESQKFADEMNDYINNSKKINPNASWHVVHHARKYFAEGITERSKLIEKFNNFRVEENYIQLKTNYLKNSY